MKTECKYTLSIRNIEFKIKVHCRHVGDPQIEILQWFTHLVHEGIIGFLY